MALLLNRDSIQELLTMEECIDLVEKAFAELFQGTAVMPQRTAVTDVERSGWYAFMPAQLKGMGALGIKAVTVYTQNLARHGLPSTLATIILLDAETGQAVSVMDGGYLTAMRTGAVSGVATRYLARQDARVAGVLGTGVQARTQLRAMAAVRKLESALCYSMDTPEAQKAFAHDMSQRLGIPVEVAGSAQQVIERADLLSLATTAHEPIMDGRWLKAGTHINGIGSHRPDTREIDTETVVKSKVVCDQKEACLAEAGDLIIPIREGAYSADRIYGELGELVTGKKPGRESDAEITLFKSVGLSIQDISVAHLVYQKARERGIGTEFEF
jgi:alanine dehydrogenase